ncbi:MAG TPA: hypothetical protein DHW86_07290, partial [Rhodobiaceae bacterium]|nr:hypothetical protein [Rhodobiaceae bacterium]
MNRGTISADGLYDGFKADAVLLDTNANIDGGIYHSGTISATAYNHNARALIINGATLTEGLRDDNSVFLNEGTVSARVSTHTGSDSSKTKSSDSATAIYLSAATTLTPSANPLFLNRGLVSATNNFITAATDTSAQNSEAGDNATAFDFSTYNGNVDIRQEMPRNDLLLDASAPNANTNPYLGGGDLDIDFNGDGAIDTRDVPAPRITGDVKFGAGDNDFTINAGTVNGNISFGGGSDMLTLTNEIADDTEDDYPAPITGFTGSIANGSGTDLD